MLSCIYAELESNHGIGFKEDNGKFKLPWDNLRVKDLLDRDYNSLYYRVNYLDMQYFKHYTANKNIVMGYNTWKSLNETTFKGRKLFFIITHFPEKHKSSYTSSDVIYITLDDMIRLLCIDNENEYVCIGGSSILNELIPYSTYVHVNSLSFDEEILKNDGFEEPKANIFFNIDDYKKYFTDGILEYSEMNLYGGKLILKTYYNKLSNMFKQKHFLE